MELIPNVEFKYKNKSIRLNITRYSRNGSKSPDLLIVHFNGKRIIPFKFERSGLEWVWTGILRVVYFSKITDDLIYKHNPFLVLIKSD